MMYEGYPSKGYPNICAVENECKLEHIPSYSNLSTILAMVLSD